MIFEDQLAALEADSQEGRHPGRRDRLRAAARRPAGRARAGHHHRRRLPLLLHRPAQVHRRRHPGPRAVHPQHGHRRLDRRPRHHPDRRPQGRADPDPAPQLPRVAARHPARRAGDQQDGPRRLLARRCSTRSRRTTATFAARIGLADIAVHPAVGARRATTSSSRSDNTPWYHGPTLMELPGDGAGRRRPADAAVPHAGAVGQPPEPRLPRLCRADRQRRRSSPGDRIRVLPSGATSHGRRASSPPTAT